MPRADSVQKSGLPPVVDENTEILILGTLPSEISLGAAFDGVDRLYRFWKDHRAILEHMPKTSPPELTLSSAEQKEMDLVSKANLVD